jgi:hypothetical protein
MKSQLLKKIAYCLVVPLFVPIVLLLQKYNQFIDYDGSYLEILSNYFITVLGLLLIYGISFLIKYLRKSISTHK